MFNVQTSTNRSDSKAAASSPTSAGLKQQLVIEADGADWHDDRLTREDDAERQASWKPTASA